ncbi:MAG: 50S ribosomal protein L11 methyltransferase [Gemmatimonadaceae bacterium]|nr:50S ribosomal protein L11 methyltransferase [Chitinophagaceae bacterium]
MKEYLRLNVSIKGQEEKDLLIAEMIGMDFEGFEELKDSVAAYIASDLFKPGVFKEFASERNLGWSVETVAEKNWNEEWEKDFDPVIIDEFCIIRAGFHARRTEIQYDILITPKMSFGTGHHATTWMMIKAMQTMDFTGKKVLDFGTGTGILAILAEKIGSKEITAIDNDDWSINNAAENITNNYCRIIKLEKAETLQLNEQFDIILANINRNVILAELANIRQHLAKRGVLLVSGLLETDENVILEAAAAQNLHFSKIQKRHGWISLELKTDDEN